MLFKNDLKEKLECVGWEYKLSRYEKSYDSVAYQNIIESPNASVIIISWQYCPEIEACITALKAQKDAHFELIFVDNGAGDGSFSIIEDSIDTYVRINKNNGAYEARNIGSLYAKSDILVFLDDDAIADTNFVSSHINAHVKYDVISVRGMVKGADPNNSFNQLAGHYNLGDIPFPIFCDAECNVSYQRKVFFEVGGWSDDIHFGCGGAELSLRILKVDSDYRKQIYSPEPVIYHNYADNEAHLHEKKEKQNKSRILLRQKYPEWDTFLRSWRIFRKREDLLIKR